MNDITVLYYTANTEDEKFEENIRKELVKNSGDLPIVSVSQKPIDLGLNICVGEQKHCYASEFMQIRKGLEAIKTDYVITAESDFLYPPEYFSHIPKESGKCYRFFGVWIAFDKFYFKGCSDGAQMIDRKMWLDMINTALPEKDNWNQELICRCQPSPTDWKITWTSTNPAISFKTDRNISKRTQLKKDILPVTTLPYWGDINSLTKKLFK